MCKTTHTHYTCLCIHLIVHSCILNFPLGHLVCPPPHLIKKDIYVYAKCDDCISAFDEREERTAKKVGGGSVEKGNVDVLEGVEVERASGGGQDGEEEEEEGEIYDVDRGLKRGLAGNGKGEEEEEDDDDDVQAAAQLFSTLIQEEGRSERDGSGDIEVEGEDSQYVGHELRENSGR